MFTPDPELARTRVLVVDDDDDMRELMKSFLEMYGIAVETAGSGNEGYAAFERTRPDVIVSDIQMADGTGFDFIAKVRALPPEHGGLTPAIATSGAVPFDECLDAGFQFHFSKPLQAGMLLDAIRSFVRDEPSTAPPPWHIAVEQDSVWLRLDGNMSSADMRAMTSALIPILHAAPDGYRVVSDLRRLGSFAPAVGAVAQSGVWGVRHKIRSVVVVGGSRLARAISRSACLILGIGCVFSDEPPK